MIWSGEYIYSDDPVRVWIDGERIVLVVPAVADSPVAIRRTTEAGAVDRAIDVADALPAFRLLIDFGETVCVGRYRRGIAGSTATANAWTALPFGLAATGWESDGVTTILWSEIEPNWHAITARLGPPSPASTPARLLVYFDDGSRAVELDTADPTALHTLCALIAAATRPK